MSIRGRLTNGRDFEYIYKHYVPEIPYKIREKLCLRGKQVDFDDFTKFVYRDNVPLPIWGAKTNVKADEKIIDLAPFICCALPDVLLTIPKVGYTLLMEATSAVFDYYLFDTNKEYVQTLDSFTLLPMTNQKFEDDDEAEEFDEPMNLQLGVFYHLQRIWHIRDESTVRDLSNAMMVLYLLDKSCFVDYLITICEVLYPFVDIFFSTFPCIVVEDEYLFKHYYNETFEAEKICYGMLPYDTRCMEDGGITDGSGIGAYALFSLCRELYKNWWQGSNEYILYLTDDEFDADAVFSKMTKLCTGTDFAARYLSGKANRVPRFIMNQSAQSLRSHGVVPTEGTRRYKSSARKKDKDGDGVDLALYQSMLVSGYLYGDKLPTPESWVNCHWGTLFSMQRSLTFFYSREQADNLEIEEEKYDIAIMLAEQEEDIRKEYDGWATRAEYTSVCNENKRLESTVESLENRVKELEKQLSAKQDIVEKLTDNLSVLNKRIQSYYSDDDEFVDEEADADISIEEMVSFLNEFHIVLGGGFNTLFDRCNELGWTNVTQIETATFVNGAVVRGDFFVVNTRFIAHKLVSAMRSKYKAQNDCFLYYNGTSVRSLIRACYDFIQKYFN